MIEDSPLLRPKVGATLPTSEASAGWVLVELRSLALRTLRLREPCVEQKAKAGVVIGKRLVEVKDGEAWTFHRIGGKMSLAYSSCS